MTIFNDKFSRYARFLAKRNVIFMAWDYKKTEFNKQAKADPVWFLERLINYGLNDQKIDKKILKKYFQTLKIPENRRVFLELLLWNKPF